MISLLRRITQAFGVTNPRLRWKRAHFRLVMSELHRRGRGQHESGVFLLGNRCGSYHVITDAIYYDELDSRAYDSGVCILHGEAFGKLWGLCRERGLEVIADAHTHPGGAGQSGSDRKNPMVAISGHIALIIPQFARAPMKPEQLGIYEYLGNHNWRQHGGRHWKRFIALEGRKA